MSPVSQMRVSQLGRSWWSSSRTTHFSVPLYARVNLIIFIFYFAVFCTFLFLRLLLLAQRPTCIYQDIACVRLLSGCSFGVTLIVFPASPAAPSFLHVFASNFPARSWFCIPTSRAHLVLPAYTSQSTSEVIWFIFLLLVFGDVFFRLLVWWRWDTCLRGWLDTPHVN